MDKKALLTAIAAVLTTALETEPDFFPESMGYMALNCNNSEWNHVRGVLVDSQLITVRGNSIYLTTKGRELAKQIEATLAK